MKHTMITLGKNLSLLSLRSGDYSIQFAGLGEIGILNWNPEHNRYTLLYILTGGGISGFGKGNPNTKTGQQKIQAHIHRLLNEETDCTPEEIEMSLLVALLTGKLSVK